MAQNRIELPGDIFGWDASERRQCWMLELFRLQEQVPVGSSCLPGEVYRQELLGDGAVKRGCWICVRPKEKCCVPTIADIVCQGLPQF